MTRFEDTQPKIRRQITLPNSEAIKIAIRSIRIRFWRSMITTSGVILTIAFLSYVLISNVILASVPFEKGEYAVSSKQEEIRQYWLIGISLLVCLVGITNAMLMSVTERFREIGTMKCLGALDWFVVKLFLIEALFQGILGSIIGSTIGFVGAILVALTEHGKLIMGVLPWPAIFLRVLLSILVGGFLAVIGSVYPARRAGKMPPADAMRTEI